MSWADDERATKSREAHRRAEDHVNSKLTYKTLADAHTKQPTRPRFLIALVNTADHKAMYWASRYQSIHRLITHCSHRPKQFMASGYKIVEVEPI